MLTLTYPAEFPLDGRKVKGDWRRMRQWLVRCGISTGLWFLEFQRRGAPHFHVFIPGRVDLKAVAQAWYRIVGSGDERHLWAGTRVEALRNPGAAGAYAAKYASKRLQKEVPDGFSEVGRFWGVWGTPQIAAETVLRGDEAVSLVRAIRRGYQAKRKSWRCRRRFRDNGRSGFTGWESGALAARALAILTAPEAHLILSVEHSRRPLVGRYKSGGWANANTGGIANEAQGSRESRNALRAHAHSIDQVRPWPDRLE